MIKLEWFNGKTWVEAGLFYNENMALVSLGGDDYNYRTVNEETGEVLTDKSTRATPANALHTVEPGTKAGRQSKPD